MQSATKEAGSILDGKFRVVRPIGAGGMGAVYEVEHTLTKHRRALKLLNEQMAKIPTIVERFLREASAAGHIKNPHVIETFDAGTLVSGEPYIVMELLSGETLADLIARRGALGVVETCDLLMQACDGIGAAHAAGIVHRDLKPENLFLLGTSPPFVKILDFGISKFDPALTGAHSMTSEGSTMGTPYYMPPEQARGEKDLGTQADVYALGVVLYECLCAAKPFDAETLAHLAVLIADGKYEPPTRRRPDLPRELDAVVARAMASNRADRYESVAELAEALRSLKGRSGSATDSAMALASTAPSMLAGRDDQTAKASDGTAFAATALANAPVTNAAAQTGAPLSHTAPASEVSRRRTLVRWLAMGSALAALAVGVALSRTSEDGPDVREDASAARHEQAAPAPTSPASATMGAALPIVPAPTVTLSPVISTAPAPPPSASVRRMRLAPSIAKSAPTAEPPRKPASRAAEQGLSEQNPFR